MNREEQMAYAAGAIEGDGSFFITKRVSPKCIRYVAGANIGKSSKELIGFFVSLFSGNTYERGDHCTWQIHSQIRVKPFIEAILPYLIMKKDRALHILEWFKTGSDKEEAYLKMKELNNSCIKDYVPCGHLYEIDNDSKKWAYIAGLMDTDGSFMLHKRNLKTMKNPSYLPKVSFGEKDSRVVSFIQQTFPRGKVNRKENDNVCGGRFCWELVVKEDICEFIRRVLPYLKVKKTNAEIVLKFCENMKPLKKDHRFGVPKEELEFREKCYQELIPIQRRK